MTSSPRNVLCLSAILVLSCDEPADSAASEATASQGETVEVPASAGQGGVAPEVAAQNHARRSARYLGQTLKERLQEALAEGDPAAAVRVCSTEAREIVRELESHGSLKVGRSSLRLRNPQNAPPDWVDSWLRTQGERPAAGVPGLPENAHPARFLAPIAIEQVCLTCHGPPDTIPPEVRSVLRELYPNDQATGYAVGDLRGALWAESLSL